MAKQYWLFKSEPNTFSFDDLRKAPDQTTLWDGVRNYQARNFLRDQVQVGDTVLFYHSSTQPLAIAGTAKVVRTGYPDPTQFDEDGPYFDPKATVQAPRWYVVDVQADLTFDAPVTRAELAEIPECGKMVLLQKGSRLSIQPVHEIEFKAIMKFAKKKKR